MEHEEIPQTEKDKSIVVVEETEQRLGNIQNDFSEVMDQIDVTNSDWIREESPTPLRDIYTNITEARGFCAEAGTVAEFEVLSETSEANRAWKTKDTARPQLEKVLVLLTKAEMEIDEARDTYRNTESELDIDGYKFGEHKSLLTTLKFLSNYIEHTANQVEKLRGKHGVLLLDE